MASVIPVPDNSRQVAFHELLVVARQSWLIDAVKEAIVEVDPNRLRGELALFVPADAHQLLAAAGLPDECVFPLPSILEAKPTLVGYYRLLLGSPQKTFYGVGSGLGKFKSMEENGSLNKNQIAGLPDFCTAMGVALAGMVRQLSPAIGKRDLIELPVMTLGQKFQGANNNSIGQEAVKGVFRAIKEIVHAHIVVDDGTTVTIKNPFGKTFQLVLASDLIFEFRNSILQARFIASPWKSRVVRILRINTTESERLRSLTYRRNQKATGTSGRLFAPTRWMQPPGASRLQQWLV